MQKNMLHLRDITRGLFAALHAVPKAGYHWVEKVWMVDQPLRDAPEERDGPWLVEAPADDTGPWGYNRPPLRTSDVHRRFAGLRTQRDIVQFANKYGRLGKDPKHIIYPMYEKEAFIRGEYRFEVAEHLATWEHEIAWMDILVKLWDLASQGQEDALQHFITWEQSPRGVKIQCQYLFDRQRRLVSSYDRSPRTSGIKAYQVNTRVLREDSPHGREILSHFTGDAVLDPVRWYVKQQVNKRLKGHVSPIVLIPHDALYFEPDSLLAALYALFALELSGQGKPHILCARRGCGEYVTVERKTRQYCSDRCRKLAGYYRKKERMRGDASEMQEADSPS